MVFGANKSITCGWCKRVTNMWCYLLFPQGMEKKGTGHLGARQVQMISKAIANYKLNAGTDRFKIIRICHKYSE
jgi:hypothetical protein